MFQNAEDSGMDSEALEDIGAPDKRILVPEGLRGAKHFCWPTSDCAVNWHILLGQATEFWGMVFYSNKNFSPQIIDKLALKMLLRNKPK